MTRQTKCVTSTKPVSVHMVSVAESSLMMSNVHFLILSDALDTVKQVTRADMGVKKGVDVLISIQSSVEIQLRAGYVQIRNALLYTSRAPCERNHQKWRIVSQQMRNVIHPLSLFLQGNQRSSNVENSSNDFLELKLMIQSMESRYQQEMSSLKSSLAHNQLLTGMQMPPVMNCWQPQQFQQMPATTTHQQFQHASPVPTFIPQSAC